MNRKTLAGDRRRRKMMTALWVFIFSVVVIFLIYREMTAVLYILVTLGITALLLLVAFSDLSHPGGNSDQMGQSNDPSGATKNLS